MKEIIENYAQELSFYLHETRHYLHQHPELSFTEFNTQKFIENELSKLVLNTEKVAGTGISAIIKAELPSSKTIALRADMDALPINELNDVPYKSTVPNVMHACGHDAHTAMLLGAAAILVKLKSQLKGNVKLIFQPAEEKLPGGALKMIEEGILQHPEVDSVIGQHVFPDLPAGKVGFCSGNYMASTDEIYITVKGKGGHAATPWTVIDPVSISAQLITSLQQVVSRKTPAFMPSVLSFGKIIANGATNIIPDEVYLEGTFRTFDEKHRHEVHRLINEITHSVVEGLQAKADIEIRNGYPVLYNNPELNARAMKYALQYLGKDNVVELPQRMTSEDFSYFGLHKPSLFYRVGTAFTAKENFPLHNARFDIDESSLITGAGLMAFMAFSELEYA